MTRAELRATLVERALEAWLPGQWGETSARTPAVAGRLRFDMGAVIDALGVLDAAEALESAAGQKIGWACKVRAALRRIREGQP